MLGDFVSVLCVGVYTIYCAQQRDVTLKHLWIVNPFLLPYEANVVFLLRGVSCLRK